MLLKNLMEDKQLNFSQPLLSVRRFSSTVTFEKDDKRQTDIFIPSIPPLPSYKSELKSGPVTNPGTVPFLWEQSPGRPKGKNKPQTHAIEKPPVAPKLPPGRILEAKKKDMDKVSEGPSVTKCPGEVYYGLQSVPSPEEINRFDNSKYRMEEESSDSGDGDEAYLDALDTLSQTESFFLNCSASGVSGLDGPDVKPSGTFSTDCQTRDFMMGRFLPAAKAMASETPQYAPRKQPMVWDQPRKVKKATSGNKWHPPRSEPNVVPHYAEENSEEENDDDYDEHGKLSAKFCGLLPRFCIKNSFCLLNPVPGMSVRTRVPMSPDSRMQAFSSSAGSCSEIEKERARVAIHEQRSIGGLQPTELNEYNSVVNNEFRITYQGNSQKLEGSTLYRRLQHSGMSSYCNKLPQSPFSDPKEFLSSPGEELKNSELNGPRKKGPISFRELLAEDGTSNGEIDLGSPMVEKTLYVDIVHKVESPKLNSCSQNKKGLLNLRENDFKILAESKGIEETTSVDYSFKDIEDWNIAVEEVVLQPNAQKLVDFCLPSSAEKSNQETGMDILKSFEQDEDLQNGSSTSDNLKVRDIVNLDFEVQQPPKSQKFENSNGSYSDFPVPPPLPKSPSDSWLWRTLPSISSKNPSLRSYLGKGNNPRNQPSKTSSVDPKWETIVTSTKGQHQHLRFSEVN